MEVDGCSIPGTRVECPPFVCRPDAQLNPKKKVIQKMDYAHFILLF